MGFDFMGPEFDKLSEAFAEDCIEFCMRFDIGICKIPKEERKFCKHFILIPSNLIEYNNLKRQLLGEL